MHQKLMVQRIQSLYLFLTILAQVLVSQFAFLSFTKDEIKYTLTASGIFNDAGVNFDSDYKQAIVLVLNCIFALLAILLYKNRALQIKLTRLIAYTCLAQITFIALSFYQLSRESSHLSIGLSSILVPLAMVLAILAGKAIKKDEDLIRSVDRIR